MLYGGNIIDDQNQQLSKESEKNMHPDGTDTTNTNNKKKRSANKDRSNAKYSEADFRNLPRDEQFKLAKKYLSCHVKDFDDNTFQFSRGHFEKICEDLGFIRGIIDKKNTNSDNNTNIDFRINPQICISRAKRQKSCRKKITLSKSTVTKLDLLFGTNLTSPARSKAIDAILSCTLDELLKAKEKDMFKVYYPPSDAERLF